MIEAEIYRIYRCTECKGELGVKQSFSDDFLHECPYCGCKDGLVIKKAESSLACFTSNNQTLGSLADKNRTKRERSGESTEGWRKKAKTPFWRDKEKIDFEILKNPEQYIDTGKK